MGTSAHRRARICPTYYWLQFFPILGDVLNNDQQPGVPQQPENGWQQPGQQNQQGRPDQQGQPGQQNQPCQYQPTPGQPPYPPRADQYNAGQPPYGDPNQGPYLSDILLVAVFSNIGGCLE